MTTTQNARFWVLGPGAGWVKLTIRPGDALTWSAGERTDEGYSATEERWAHLGGNVLNECHNRWSDCDGPGSSSHVSSCELGQLRARNTDRTPPGGAPRWEHLSSSQRDYFAEAAGY